MKVGERIKQVRKELNLSQTEFGSRIGLKQAVIGQIEAGSRNLTERNANAIQREFGINQEWIYHGIGEKYIPTNQTSIDQIVDKYNLRPMDKAILEAFAKLPEEYRDGVLEYAKTLVASVMPESEQYQQIIDLKAEQENQALRDNPVFNLPLSDTGEDGDEKAHA